MKALVRTSFFSLAFPDPSVSGWPPVERPQPGSDGRGRAQLAPANLIAGYKGPPPQ